MSRRLLAGLIAGAVLLCASVADAAITVTSLMTSGATGCSAGGTACQSAVLAAGATANSHTVVMVAIHGNASAATTSSVTDTQGNTYTGYGNGASTNTNAQLFCSLIATSLTTADKITGNFGSTLGVKITSAVAVTGVNGCTADVNATPVSASTTTPSITGTPATSGVAFGIISMTPAATITAEASGWTLIKDAVSTGDLHWAYKLSTASSALTYNPTLNAAQPSVQELVSITQQSSSTPVCMRAMFGVGGC